MVVAVQDELRNRCTPQELKPRRVPACSDDGDRRDEQRPSGGAARRSPGV